MGYSGARSLGAAARGVFGIGDALMRIGQRQGEDERYAAEQAQQNALQAENTRRYNLGRQDDLRAQGYEINPINDSTAMGRAIMGANQATGTQMSGSGFVVGRRDPMQSYAVQNEYALDRAKADHSLAVAEQHVRGMWEGPNDISAYTTLPENLRGAIDSEAEGKAYQIVAQYGGDMAGAMKAADSLGGPAGVRARNAINRIYGQRALADAGDDGESWTLVNQPGVAPYQVNDRTGQTRPVAQPARPVGGAGGGSPDSKMAELEALAASGSPMADVALIMAFNKVLDPTSTVREGEFQTVQSAGGWKDRLGNWWQRVKTGGRLTDDQRRDLLNQARNVLGARGATAVTPGQDPDAIMDQMIAAGKSDDEIEAELRRLGF